MAEFKLERFKYRWRGDWQSGTIYARDDIVRVGGKSYVCVVSHTSESEFRTDLTAILPESNPPQPQPKWVVMTDGRIYRGVWNTSTVYDVGDIVLVDGSLFVCITGHTSSTFDVDYQNWSTFADHIKYKANWETATAYADGALVKYNGIVYKCKVPHISQVTLEQDIEKWEVFHDGIEFAGTWTSSTLYRKNDYVRYGGSIFRCTETHTSTNELDQEKFTIELPGYQFDGQWSAETWYQPGDVVRYGGYLYYANKVNINTDPYDPDVDSTKTWIQMSYSYNFRGDYDTTIPPSKNYTLDVTPVDSSAYAILGSDREGDVNTNNPTIRIQVGDTISFNVNASGHPFYIKTTASTGTGDQVSGVTNNGAEQGTVSWTASATGTYYYNCSIHSAMVGQIIVSTYSDSATYNPGDIVQRGGILYIAKVDIDTADLQGYDGSSLDYLEDNVWDIFAPSLRYRGYWLEGSEYLKNEVVYFKGNAYVCNTVHIASSENFPGDNGSGYFYWDILVQAGQEGGMYRKGDLLTYDLSRPLANDGSTLGDTRVPIGTTNQLLSVDSDDSAFWRDLLADADVVFVATNGTDTLDDGFGLSKYKPFKTIAFASEYVEDNFPPLTPVKISVSTGRYDEVLPIVVPAGCVVMGDELRSTNIRPAAADTRYTGDLDFHIDLVDYISSLLFNIMNNIEVPVYAGVTASQSIIRLSAGTVPANTSTNTLNDYKLKLNFDLGDGETDPVVSGTNDLSTDENFLNAALSLTDNRQFLVQQCQKYLAETFPLESFDDNKTAEDVRSIIRALSYDLKYVGNYMTIRAAKKYINKTNGNIFQDMFYVRDTTGVRNCTVEGLSGTLNPPGVFDLYQRPTGGSYISLDPGWGPADTSVWINNRSPYIQGVTTIGANCVGQKVDGALHNGGNKSITSNDFTQVISDGIGAWVLNNARAELVSVFTYYAQVGYLAEDGGIIRATNGNNSYGSYGAIADGFDITETPSFAKTFNRQGEAIVESAFSGDLADEIILLEYEHAGEQYTSAVADIVGSGINANVEFSDFRDSAIKQMRLIGADGSGASGGIGYVTSRGNAQTGNTTSITIAATDGNDADTYVGMRLLIVSGDGSGQYGYIQSFNEVTKVADIYKETTDEPGWDHLIPGTEILPTLTTNAQYQIEPRVAVSEPPFTTSVHELPTGRFVKDVTQGSTSAEYLNRTGATGSADVDESVTITGAIFDITRNGSAYSVSLVDGGAGYAIDDTITFTGDTLDGVSPANDLVITVTANTDDSTNAVTGFTFEGTPVAGRFVSIATPNFVQYSDDGETWSETTLPSTGDWKKIVSGLGVFIVMQEGTNTLAYSQNGITWISRTLPAGPAWTDMTFANGYFVAVAQNSNTVAYSQDGLTWNTSDIPDQADSASRQWQKVTYGAGRWVIISGGEELSVAYSDNLTSWTVNEPALPPIFDADWVGFEFGNNRFLAIDKQGNTAYSIDRGITWNGATSFRTSQDGSTAMDFYGLQFGQGQFYAICDTGSKVIAGDATTGPTSYSVSTEDGILWTERTLPVEKEWRAITFASFNNKPTFLLVAQLEADDTVVKVNLGAQAKLRADVQTGGFANILIWDPGSGYDTETLPTVTITDNSFTTAVEYEVKLGNKVLAQPAFINRGQGYRTASTIITITGDGYAERTPEDNIVVLVGLEQLPGPGAQIIFDGVLNTDTIEPDDLKTFRAVIITDLGDDGSGAGTRKAQIQIGPRLESADNLGHNVDVTLRERFAQCRITGHDFLDIGTGNFEQTNYPELYAGGAFFTALPENEVLELNGGRVFYTSTDQDGNFRAGELFSVEQATGIVTISAEFFDLDGLSELALGGVRLGGSGTVVREFSTDGTFTEDSNNVVPTQRAIATFLASRLSEGGSELETNILVAGVTKLGGPNNLLTTTTGVDVNIPVPANIAGDKAALQGAYWAQKLFLRYYDETEL